MSAPGNGAAQHSEFRKSDRHESGTGVSGRRKRSSDRIWFAPGTGGRWRFDCGAGGVRRRLRGHVKFASRSALRNTGERNAGAQLDYVFRERDQGV